MNIKSLSGLAPLAAAIVAVLVLVNTCEAAFYDNQYNDYVLYNSIANSSYPSYGYWAWSYWYYGFAVPSFNYFLAGYYGDLYGYYDADGYKLYGAGPYWWQYYTSVGDWWWNNY
jgi:hypothetical protein